MNTPELSGGSHGSPGLGIIKRLRLRAVYRDLHSFQLTLGLRKIPRVQGYETIVKTIKEQPEHSRPMDIDSLPDASKQARAVIVGH
jgi:hypothetical protein